MISGHIRAGLVDLEQQLPSDSADCSDLCLGNERSEGKETSPREGVMQPDEKPLP